VITSPSSRDESGSSVLYHLYLLQQLTTYTSEHTQLLNKASNVKEYLIDRSCLVWKKHDRLRAAMWLAVVSSLSIRTPRSLTTADNCTAAFGKVNVCDVTLTIIDVEDSKSPT